MCRSDPLVDPADRFCGLMEDTQQLMKTAWLLASVMISFVKQET
jgi:hypothetical protein